MSAAASESPSQEEARRLRARIAELEEEIRQIRDSDNADLFRESDVRYKKVFDNISVCMFLLDVTSDGRFRFAGLNPAEEKAVGLSSREVSGKFIEDVFPEDLARKVTANYRRCLEGGAPITYDDELNLPLGLKYFHSNLIPVRDGSGRIHRIVGACIDTTDFKRAQQRALAAQKLESLGVLAAGIAHDFKNLLASIGMETELLMEETEEKSPVREGLSRIGAVAARASEIVHQLMIYSGKEGAGFEQVDLVRLLREMIQLMQVSITKSAKLEVHLSDDLPAIRANPAQIRQVLLNLITNASEALGGKPGVISITLAEAHVDGEPLGDQASELLPGNYVRLEVSDNGCGMSPEIQAAMFDPFFTTKGAGRGLGLASAQGIIRSHSGKMTVISAAGRGSRFLVWLPCVARPEKISTGGA